MASAYECDLCGVLYKKYTPKEVSSVNKSTKTWKTVKIVPYYKLYNYGDILGSSSIKADVCLDCAILLCDLLKNMYENLKMD